MLTFSPTLVYITSTPRTLLSTQSTMHILFLHSRHHLELQKARTAFFVLHPHEQLRFATSYSWLVYMDFKVITLLIFSLAEKDQIVFLRKISFAWNIICWKSNVQIEPQKSNWINFSTSLKFFFAKIPLIDHKVSAF